jgi:hypothetical protein
MARLWIVIGFIGSLGLNSFFHAFLYDAVPGFKAIRAPARWAAIAYLGMAMLVAVACSIIPRRWWPIAWILPFAFIAELWSAPIRWYIAEPDPPPVYSWLSRQHTKGALIELPLDVAGSEYTYLLRASAHHRRMVNGVSGFAPPEFITLNGMWKTEPIADEFIGELRRIGVETIVIHADLLGAYDASTRAWLKRELDRGNLNFVGRFDDGVSGDWVFSVPSSRAQTGMSVPQGELEMFLRSQATMNADTFGRFDAPPKAIKGPAFFTGFAFSPFGVRGVDLLFENGTVRIPAQLFEETSLSQRFAGYPTPKPRFASGLGARPPGVRRESDVQAEIIDGRGRRKRLDHFWIVWQ